MKFNKATKNLLSEEKMVEVRNTKALSENLVDEAEIKSICDGIDTYDFDDYEDFLSACLDDTLKDDDEENDDYNEEVREIVYEYAEELYGNDDDDDESWD